MTSAKTIISGRCRRGHVSHGIAHIITDSLKLLLTAMWRIMKLVLTGTALLRKIETDTVDECYCMLKMVSIIRKSLN